MQEVVTHAITEDQNIAVKITDANIILDSKTPQTCILEDCVDDRDPGKYVLTVTAKITNLSLDEYYDSPILFQVEDMQGKRYDSASGLFGFGMQSLSKGESYSTKMKYDVDPPISQYYLILKQHWSDNETIILLDGMQKLRPELCSGDSDCFGGFVEKIVDGRTIDILDIESMEVKRVILALIDTPEVGGVNYENTKDFTEGFCPIDSYVLFDEDDGQTERSFERQIGKLYCEGESINEKLLEHDLAIIDTRSCKVSEYADEPWIQNYGCN